MMYLWKPDMIRFMRDASEYCTYYSELAKLIQPYLGKDSHVCDAGCGLGYLSLELAKSVKKVTAADINSDALSVLRDNCAKHGISNIETVCGDVFDMPPEEKYTAMVFCYFGEIETIVERASDICSGTIFIFKRIYELHHFPEKSIRSEKHSYEYACSRLNELGIGYKSFELENEFGQPFKSVDDARRFYELYSLDGSKRVINDLLLLDRLEYTGRDDFPLYMPYTKKTGCIILNSQA